MWPFLLRLLATQPWVPIAPLLGRDFPTIRRLMELDGGQRMRMAKAASEVRGWLRNPSSEIDLLNKDDMYGSLLKIMYDLPWNKN